MASPFVIRPAIGADAEAMRAVSTQSWLDTYTNPGLGIDEAVLMQMLNPTPERLERYRAALDRGNSPERAAWVAVAGGEVVGLCTPYTERDGRQRLGALYVEKGWWGHGIGRALLVEAIAWHDPARPFLLEVATYNTRAIGFYERHGFVRVPGEEMHGAIPVLWMSLHHADAHVDR